MGKKKNKHVDYDEQDMMDDSINLFEDPEALSKYLQGFSVESGGSKPKTNYETLVKQLANSIDSGGCCGNRAGVSYQKPKEDSFVRTDVIGGRQTHTKRTVVPDDPTQAAIGKYFPRNIAQIVRYDGVQKFLKLSDWTGNTNSIELDINKVQELKFVSDHCVEEALTYLYLAHRVCSVPDAIFERKDLEQRLHAMDVAYFVDHYDTDNDSIRFIELDGSGGQIILCYFISQVEINRFIKYLMDNLPGECLPEIITKAFVRSITLPFVEKIFYDSGEESDIGSISVEYYLEDEDLQNRFLNVVMHNVPTKKIDNVDTVTHIDVENVDACITGLFNSLGEIIVPCDEGTCDDVEESSHPDEVVNPPEPVLSEGAVEYNPYGNDSTVGENLSDSGQMKGTGVQNDNIPFLNKDNESAVGSVCTTHNRIDRTGEDDTKRGSGVSNDVVSNSSRKEEKIETEQSSTDQHRGGYRGDDRSYVEEKTETKNEETVNPTTVPTKTEEKKNEPLVVDVIKLGGKGR